MTALRSSRRLKDANYPYATSRSATGWVSRHAVPGWRCWRYVDEPGIPVKTIRPFETYLQHLSRVRTPEHRIGPRQRLPGPDLPRRQLPAAAVWLTITLYIARRPVCDR
jgi:hypothetical protein